MPAPIDDIARIITDAIHKAIQDAEPELTRIAKEGGKEAKPNPLGSVGSLVSIITDAITALPIISELVSLPLEPVKLIEQAAGDEGKSFAFGYLLGNIAFQALDPAQQVLNHAIADALQTGIFDPNTAAQLEAKGIIDNAYGRSEAAGGNLSGEHYDKLVAAAREHPDIGQVLDAWLKDVATEAQVNVVLQHHGLAPEWWPMLKALKRQFLSPADLALASLRGVITDETMQGYADQLGVTPDDMRLLVENTGEPPGLEQLLFLYRRGQLSKDRLERGIRQSRVRDEWIDAVEALRFMPMTTADAARAVVENYLTHEEGARIAEQNGLDADHWPIIVESWGRPLSHEQMMALYHRGQATLDEVKQAMRESDVKNKYIEQAIELGRVLIPERMIVMAVGHGALSHEQALTMLMERGYTDADADVLIKLGAAQRTASQHALSRTDIVSMYTDALLTKDHALQHLTKLGYTTEDAQALLQLADVKVQASARRTTQRAIEASLKAKHLTQQQAISQLEHAGIESSQARALVDEWLQQHGTVTKSLTEAQILKMGEDGVLTPAQTLDRLQAYGLSEGDARLLLKLHMIDQPGTGGLTGPQHGTTA